MTIPRDTSIENLPFGSHTARIASALAQKGLKTYGDMVEHWETRGKTFYLIEGIGFTLEATLVDWLNEQPIGAPGSRRGELENVSGKEAQEHVQSNSFSITTHGMSLPDKIESATISVADDMKEVAKEQFRKGAVAISP